MCLYCPPYVLQSLPIQLPIFITFIILGEYRSQSSSLCSLRHSHAQISSSTPSPRIYITTCIKWKYQCNCSHYLQTWKLKETILSNGWSEIRTLTKPLPMLNTAVECCNDRISPKANCPNPVCYAYTNVSTCEMLMMVGYSEHECNFQCPLWRFRRGISL